ncbi:MAG: helix-turn-helix transcriptional regulator [Oscillospiraceae bacterium]|nr:helix-turn-helix transcriptional regulator [Oscillospiraceae bacterium]
MTTGEKIRKRRLKNVLTLEQLGELMELSPLTIDRWEAGLEHPDETQLRKLCEILGCDYERLLPYEENIKPLPKGFSRESKVKLGALPLWHICFDPLDYAEAVFAIGFRARGIVAIGLMSVGFISVGVLSAGLLALCFAGVGIWSWGYFHINVLQSLMPWIETVWGYLSLLFDNY